MSVAPQPVPIRFPASFGTRVIVSIDTEEEFDWSQPKRREATSVKAIETLPQAHAMLRDFGITPLYMVDYAVVMAPRSRDIIKEFIAAGECDIGTQLHPWITPPFDEPLTEHFSFPGNLPYDLEKAKLTTITRAIVDNLGVQPKIYRAGRYGIGPNSQAILHEMGYAIDSSVRPFFDYSPEGGPNFLDSMQGPYWTSPQKHLVELPLTTVLIGTLRHLGARTIHKYANSRHWCRGSLARSGMLTRIALTPEGFPVNKAREAVRQAVGDGQQILHISFHSPSVEPGHTPYVRTASDLRDFRVWFDEIFSLLHQMHVQPIDLDSLLEAIEGTR